MMEFIRCQKNSRALVFFLTLNVLFVMSVLYWTFSSGPNSSPFDLNWNDSLTSSSTVVKLQSISFA